MMGKILLSVLLSSFVYANMNSSLVIGTYITTECDTTFIINKDSYTLKYKARNRKGALSITGKYLNFDQLYSHFYDTIDSSFSAGGK